MSFPVLAMVLALSSASEVEARPTVLVLPADTLGDLSSVVQLRTLGVLRNLGGTNIIHPKTLNRVQERYEARLTQLSPEARHQTLGQVTGADIVIASKVQSAEGRTKLGMQLVPVEARGKSGKAVGLELEAGSWLEALDQMQAKLGAGLVETGRVPLDRTKTEGAVGPASSKPGALMAYARCHDTIVAQPAGLRSPVVVDINAIENALIDCEDALSIDPDFVDVKADIALASAYLGKQVQAEAQLKAAKKAEHFIPTYWIAKFWVLSRFHGVDVAVEALRQSIEAHPGFTLGRGYLGEALVAVGEYDEALSVYQTYLGRVPRQSFVMGQIGYVHAKKKDYDEAVEWTEKALRTTPSDPELLLQLASRFIDVKRYGDAANVLRRVISEGGARGEVHLRLGYAYLKLGELNQAEAQIRTAIEKANSPAEWRTRGRARYNLAQLWVEAGSTDNAIRQLRMAVREGFKDDRALAAPDMAPVKKHPKWGELLAMRPPRGTAPTLISPPRQSRRRGRRRSQYPQGLKQAS
ncbi:MAG: tetratricopeptide repeat protein [Myxococcota bacterium]